MIYTLNGEWCIAKDNENRGIELGWNKALPDDVKKIRIPHFMGQKEWEGEYSYSNIFSMYHGFVWYYYELDGVPRAEEKHRYRLEFDRGGYVCEVWLNGAYIGKHMGHDTRFSFDVTDAVIPVGKNLLAVRCFEPLLGGREIDGITIENIPNAFAAADEETVDYSSPSECVGGIMGEVRLLVLPDIHIEDVYVRANSRDGSVDISVTTFNGGECAEELFADITVYEQKRGVPVATARGKLKADKGKCVSSFSLKINGYKLWDIEHPALYVSDVRLCNGERRSIRFGFKDMRVKDGFFFLNGKRILLKLAHGWPTADSVIAMKAMGFNAIRCIAHLFDEEVMSLCDELGMLVVEAPRTCWGMRYHDKTEEMVVRSMSNMLIQHRNHVCVGAFYLFNELKNKDVLYCGANELPLFRELAPDSLFLLSSGRWDGEYGLGSVSNPESYEWQPMFGAEGDTDYPCREIDARVTGITRRSSLSGGKGDLHLYPLLSLDEKTRRWYRTVGADTKPVFVSEFGIGSQDDPRIAYLCGVEKGMDRDCKFLRETKAEWDELEAVIKAWGLSSVFPFATDFCRMADRLNVRQRRQMFDLLRSNPKVNGIGLTSWHSFNEGVLERDGSIIREGLAYALQEGLSPLRFALFSSDRAVFADCPFDVEAVLCNEDVLPAGSYEAEAVIWGDAGAVWFERFSAVYPSEGYGDMIPLSATVLKRSVTLPAGDYFFSVRLMEGGAPMSTELPIKVVKPVLSEDREYRIGACGLSSKTVEILRNYGVCVVDWEYDRADVILVGDSPQLQDELLMKAQNGATVVFLDCNMFDGEAGSRLLEAIAGKSAQIRNERNWIYHSDLVHAPHAVLSGINEKGIADIELLGDIYPDRLFFDGRIPDVPICTSIRADSLAHAVTAAVALGEYTCEKGRVLLNSFRIEENLNKHPFADKMLLNIIEYTAKAQGASEKTE